MSMVLATAIAVLTVRLRLVTRVAAVQAAARRCGMKPDVAMGLIPALTVAADTEIVAKSATRRTETATVRARFTAAIPRPAPAPPAPPAAKPSTKPVWSKRLAW